MIDAYRPPYSAEAESAVLGSCLLDRDALEETLSTLTPEDFFIQKHQMIFLAIKELSKKGEIADIVSVTNYNKEIDVEYLAETMSNIPSAANILHHLKIVHNNSTRREIIKISSEIIKESYDNNLDVDELLSKLESDALKINRVVSRNIATMREALNSTLEQLEQRYNRNGEISGTSTGFKSLDNKLGGLQNTELYIIAARPSMGKTALAENIATHVALKEKLPVLFFSMEMSKERIIDRMISSFGGISANKVKTGEINEREWATVIETANMLGESNMYIDDTPNLKATEIKAKCRRIRGNGKLGLIVVDHLTEMWRPMSGRDVQEHEANVREMKRLAKEMDCPVILLQQLNRGMERRNNKRPELSDLKETGASEEVADVVIMLYRDDYYNENSEEKNIAEIIIKKGRNVGVGTIKMAWLPVYTKFAELHRER